ncbi:hypothetical protein [Pseudomonas phage L15]|nr:hypothetical protein [Pseudomonas phage L15]
MMTRTYLKRVVIRDENGLFVADGDNLIDALREVKLHNLLKQLRVLDQEEGHRWMFQFSHVNNHIVLIKQSPDCCDGIIRMEDLR